MFGIFTDGYGNHEPLTPTSPAHGNEKWDKEAATTVGVQKVALSQFQKLRRARVNPWDGRKLATFLAAYPIAKIAIALVKGATISAAIALPPVALGLLIAATSLFVLCTLAIIIINRKNPALLKYTLIKEPIKFAAAPVSLLIVAIVCFIKPIAPKEKTAEARISENPMTAEATQKRKTVKIDRNH